MSYQLHTTCALQRWPSRVCLFPWLDLCGPLVELVPHFGLHADAVRPQLSTPRHGMALCASCPKAKMTVWHSISTLHACTPRRRTSRFCVKSQRFLWDEFRKFIVA